MIVLRRILAVALLATAGWLLIVLAAEAGERTGLLIAAMMMIALAVLAAGHRLAGMVRLVVLLLIAVGAIVLSTGTSPRPSMAAPPDLKGLWKPFNKEDVARYVAEGKVVFVDVTADWCITCQVNKATVVYRGRVAASLSAPGVVAMEADWTRPDDGIAAYLAGFGRYGIPFNAVYGPGAPDGIVLPELLTEEAVLDALEKAKKPS
jgi:suppressor for copper-sensitivity B